MIKYWRRIKLANSSWFRWCPTSPELLKEAERLVLCNLKTKYTGKYVNVGKVNVYEESKIYTLCFNEESNKTPIVLLHGLKVNSTYWRLNLDALADDRPVYAMDILGFGRSSRSILSLNPLKVEQEYVESIETWCRELGIDKCILLGHCFGGYLATAYAMKYPDRISHLILVDPVGIPERTSDIHKSKNHPIVVAFCQNFYIATTLRALGPLGPSFVRLIMPQTTENAYTAENLANDYYHCNVQTPPSGEIAYKHLLIAKGFGWHKYPLMNRIDTLRDDVPITFIYASHSFIDSNQGFRIRDIRKESFVDVKIIPETSHNVALDQPEPFNKLVRSIGVHVDNGWYLPNHFFSRNSKLS